jgi:hypothetical protein
VEIGFSIILLCAGGADGRTVQAVSTRYTIDVTQAHPGVYSQEGISHYGMATWVQDVRRQLINSSLRTLTGADLGDDDHRALRELDELITEGSTTHSALFYRGVATNENPVLGEVITDPGFVSLSDDREMAWTFALARSGRTTWLRRVQAGDSNLTPVLWVITVPADTPIAPGGRSVREWILGRGTTFQVVGVTPGEVQLRVLRD